MNIKKILILSCMALQFSTIMYASQTNFNAAFFKFGGGTDLVVAATNVQNNKGRSTTRGTASGLTALNNSTEAVIVSKYLTNQTLTSAETTSLNNAFSVAITGVGSTTTTTTTPTTSTSSTTTTTTVTTTDTAAAALKTQINASIGVLNSYNATKGIATVATIA